MNLLTLMIGIALPTLLGWLALLLLERKHPVLGVGERMFWALTLGPTLFITLVFLLYQTGLTSLNLTGFLIPLILGLVVLGSLSFRLKAFHVQNHSATFVQDHTPISTFAKAGIIILTLWTVIKVLAGAYDLWNVPTYWDDSFNNWNMRGKIFYETQHLELEIPIGNGIVQSSGGVSSYPPTLPLLKTWVSTLRGSWQEPVVNGIQLTWLIGLAGAFYFQLRRKLRPIFSLGGVYLLFSLPLLLIHATNPYADIFLAAHLFVVISTLYHMADARTHQEMKTWLLLFGFSFGLFLFTKNEATSLYAPIILVLLASVIVRAVKTHVMSGDESRKSVGMAFLIAALIAVPWLLFKFVHGLSFGNAKSISGLALGFNAEVLQAYWFHLAKEADWLVLPLALVLSLIASGKRAFQMPVGILTVFVLVSFFAQMLIFTVFNALAVEAIQQTGLSRGLVHLAPVVMMLVVVLVESLLKEKREE